MTAAARRWRGECATCHRQPVDLEARPEHGQRALCDDCAALHPSAPAGAQVIDHPASPLPRGGTEAMEITTGWQLHSPVVRVVLWGRRGDSPVDVHLKDGTRLRFDAATQLHKVEDLCGVLLSQTKGRTIGPVDAKRADLIRLRAALVRMAEAHEDYDDDAETREWLQRFLASTFGQVDTDLTLTDPARRYELVRRFHAARYDPQAGSAPMVAVDCETGETLIRTTDLRLFIARVLGENHSAHALATRMLRAGIPRLEAQAWPPGYGRSDRQSDPQAKRKVALYVIPPNADAPPDTEADR